MGSQIDIPIPDKTLGGVTSYLLSHPLDAVIYRWNWKAALFSSILRAPVFYVAYHKYGFSIAAGAMILQFFFRAIFGGVSGAITQAFSKVEPPWHALVTVPFFLAAFSHLVEFVVQIFFDKFNNTQSGPKAIIVSIILSVISAVFNLFAMRRGAMLVKDSQQQSIWTDVKNIPWLVFEFILLVPRRVWLMLRRKMYLQAFIMTAVTSVGLGLTVGILSERTSLGVKTALWTLGFIAAAIIGLSLWRKRAAKSEESEEKKIWT